MTEHPGKEVGCSDKQWMGGGHRKMCDCYNLKAYTT